MEFKADFNYNISMFKQLFERDDMFTLKIIVNEHNPSLKIAIALVNCMVNTEVVDRDIIAPLCKKPVSDDINFAVNSGVFVHSAKLCENATDAVINVAAGDTVIFIGDNTQVITIDTKGMKQRDVSAPETEQSVIGPSEGFNENIVTNLSLIKKRIMTHKLKNEFVTLGKQSNTKLAVCYIDGIAKPELVKEVKHRLSLIDTDFIADSNYIADFIRDNKTSFIKTYGRTNRPDVLCAKLLEGRIGIIVNGSPTALTLPFLFIENFQTPDDYYLNCWYANIGRLLRIIGFYLSFLLPAAFTAITLHNLSMLPPEWLYSISTARTGVPVPIVIEVFLLFGVFEILRETGTRMPSSIGLALNVVGAIILGQAAVDAKLVSAPTVIVVAFSGVMGLMVPNLKGAVFYLRLAMLILATVAGMPGVFIGFMLFLIILCNMSSLGVPIMYMYSFISKSSRSDTFFRSPIYKMNYRPGAFTDNIKRQGKV